MFSIKPGARIRGIAPETVLGLLIVYSVFNDHNLDFVLTEGTGGKHARGSLHYVGLAADGRRSNVPPHLVNTIKDEVSTALGEEFDFVLEPDHFHLEFQPKT